MTTLKQKALDFVNQNGIVCPSDLKGLGIPVYYLGLLKKEGKLQKLGPGQYVSLDYEFDEKLSYSAVCKKYPKAILCLLSALRYYEFTTQNPHEVWIAIDKRVRKPSISFPPVRVMRFQGRSLNEGIEKTIHRGIEIRVYNPAKTVADCFKYRNKIGLDVALEALREGFKNKLFTVDELNYYATICRVRNVMKPFIESIL